MIAIILTLSIAICAIVLVGLEDCHYRVTGLMEESDERAAQHPVSARQASLVAPTAATQHAAELSGEKLFTRSLVALSVVDSLVPCDPRAPVSANYSSLEPVHSVESAHPVQGESCPSP